MRVIKYIIGIVLLMTTVSCEKIIGIDSPRTELESGSVFTSDKTANAAMIGIYSDMNSDNYIFANLITMFMGPISADEFLYEANVATFLEFKANVVSAENTYVNSVWAQPYNYIYRCNEVIEGVTASTGMTTAMKNQLMGEAKFLRAFCYFYLTNLFGDVPLILDTDVLKNTNLPRTASASVYASIIADLLEAKSLLGDTYAGGERTRPVKAAAILMLARTYLYTGDNVNAEIQASELIAKTGTYQMLSGTALGSTFLKNSTDAVWQLNIVNTLLNKNTIEGFNMVPASLTSPATNYRLTRDPNYGLVQEFEKRDPNSTSNAIDAYDYRRGAWTGQWNVTTSGVTVTNTYPYKYKVRVSPTITEYSMVLRFAEAYLIRAEARMQLSKFALGKADLDAVRLRGGLSGVTLPTSVAAGMLLVEKERRIELFAEWGHRWFDLKRWKSVTGDPTKTRADDILPLTKPSWKSKAILMPIPAEALRTNPTLTPNPSN
ncbi:RagB/SusD family nutrient uptake outer membrane protein [Pedobacter sp. MC2016-14]|uniref:RagB/SusD family nutrient uptake outer membrane protein n=1 Tax=Pedobacter sp. MC2016-14 TaxID=2897327 RepID=UPI001E2BCBC0|nr:RagB/SusD family nutrient uptake outer membrane protein [Pedobacter sp. MC2016-14]MCD0487601.1 RagB/SusD family nutrient uptake outer membrane protein [Pedobacter sp. MC2016-14]